jgi:hypothetical protein
VVSGFRAIQFLPTFVMIASNILCGSLLIAHRSAGIIILVLVVLMPLFSVPLDHLQHSFEARWRLPSMSTLSLASKSLMITFCLAATSLGICRDPIY